MMVSLDKDFKMISGNMLGSVKKQEDLWENNHRNEIIYVLF